MSTLTAASKAVSETSGRSRLHVLSGERPGMVGRAGGDVPDGRRGLIVRQIQFNRATHRGKLICLRDRFRLLAATQQAAGVITEWK
jgi:hypothetical protein